MGWIRVKGGLRAVAGACAVLAAAMPVATLPAELLASRDLADLSLEELGNIEITSVSKHGERLSDAAASVFVITSEDIRRSGATSLGEALRLAPNLEVARTGAGTYAISARGFNNAIGNKLLVLIDGRTVYTPLYSGVNWDQQMVMLEDVERIEVISGPGGTLWGANAVNGVINVITRSSDDTQGGLAVAGGGNRELGGAARYGGAFASGGTWRVYGQGFNLDNTRTKAGASLTDGLQTGQMGFRADWGDVGGKGGSGFTLQGDAYNGRAEPDPTSPQKMSGFNVLGRWTRQAEDGAGFQLQAYFDRTTRDDPFTFADSIDTYDVQFQHGFSLQADPGSARHRILWGAGYRYAVDQTRGYFPATSLQALAFIPARMNLHWANVFVQDEIALTGNVTLTAGLKAESNIYTGVEYLPSLRLAWKPAPDQLVWTALSRAVRAPSRIDTDFYLYANLHLPAILPLVPLIAGGPGFESEVANVFELGYRAQQGSALTYSVTAYYADYDKLRSGQTPRFTVIPFSATPAQVQNMMYGTVSGVEAWGAWQVMHDWRLSGGITAMWERFHLRPGSTDPTGPSALGNDPSHAWMLRSSHNLSATLDFDLMVRFQRALPNPVVPAYTAVDARLAWRPRRGTELSITGENLLDPGHAEFNALPGRAEIGRAVFAKISQAF